MLQNKIKLFSGSSHPELAQKIADNLGIGLGDIKHAKFQCNESYVKIDETIRGRAVHPMGRNRLMLDGHVEYKKDKRTR